MRFFVDVAPDGAEWRVVVRAGSAAAPPVGERRMRRLEAAGALPVPLPPADYVADLLPTATHRELCVAATPQPIADALQRLARRTAGAGEAERFGRYLFACLLGEELWAGIRTAAAGDAIELALGWPVEQSPLARLPWELMHGPRAFLAVDDAPRTAISRRVPGTGDTAASATVTVRPRVLFVVGVSPADPAIQAGAEYLGLLRRIRAGGAALATRVLIEATPQQLADAVRVFGPSIVHFISHGSIGADGRGRLNLMSDDVKGREEPLGAAQLLAILRSGSPSPPVVVLNACETAGGIDSVGAALATPLAAELVAGGIPIVVGQGGRVADRACRLFARRFYEALLAGEPLPEATAEGRRSARALGADPSATIDWALPALFIADGVSPVTTLDGAAQLQLLESRAARLCTISNPASFCGRLECVEHYGAMLYDRAIAPVRVLAYEVAERDSTFKNPRYGKTRLLQELASYSVREGVVPVVVGFVEGDDKPKDALALGLAIMRAVYRARDEFELPAVAVADYEVRKLQRALDQPAERATLHVSVRDVLDMAPAGSGAVAQAVAAALRVDLRLLVADVVRPQSPPVPVSPVVVLVDEVHEFGDAARELLEVMLTADGLGTRAQPIPVVLAFSGSTVAGDSATAAQAITGFFERGRPYARRIYLRAFQSPIESRLAYRQYLLHQLTPLVFTDHPEDAEEIEGVLDLLQEQIRGVPSRMELTGENNDVQSIVKAARRIGPLREASDEDALVQVRGG